MFLILLRGISFPGRLSLPRFQDEPNHSICCFISILLQHPDKGGNKLPLVDRQHFYLGFKGFDGGLLRGFK